MSISEFPLRTIALFTHVDLVDAVSETEHVAEYLIQNGLQVVKGTSSDTQFRERVQSREFDLMIALGGDGTMLRAGHMCGPVNVPVLGINLGRLGFLTEIDRKDWRERLPQLLERNFWIEKRMMLRAVYTSGEQVCGSWDVLNEVYVGRGVQVRPVQLTAHVDGSFMTTYVADGLIAATASGSTAYAMAAGGPILPPTLRNILILPIAPHLSMDRPVVLDEGSSVSIVVHTAHEAALSIDGQPTIPLADGACIHVFASEYTVQFVRFQDPGYFYRNLTSHMNQNPSSGNTR